MLLFGLNPQIPTVRVLSFRGHGANTFVLQEKNEKATANPQEAANKKQLAGVGVLQPATHSV